MRDSKFRIWDKEKNCWFQPTFKAYAGEIEDLLLSPSGDLILRKYNRMEHESLFPNRFEKVWYTGLKDYAGKEIYEGDFVEEVASNNPRIFEVKWDDCGMFLFIPRSTNDGTNAVDYYELQDEVGEIIIIGNIYEHPQLLGGDS